MLCEIIPAGEFVLFGPAGMKKGLGNEILSETTLSPVNWDVETAGSMAENQIVAWVKNYCHKSHLN